MKDTFKWSFISSSSSSSLFVVKKYVNHDYDINLNKLSHKSLWHIFWTNPNPNPDPYANKEWKRMKINLT